MTKRKRPCGCFFFFCDAGKRTAKSSGFPAQRLGFRPFGERQRNTYQGGKAHKSCTNVARNLRRICTTGIPQKHWGRRHFSAPTCTTNAQQMHNKCTTDAQQMHTYKECKNEKNERAKKIRACARDTAVCMERFGAVRERRANKKSGTAQRPPAVFVMHRRLPAPQLSKSSKADAKPHRHTAGSDRR